MIRTLFDNHVFIYILLALTGCGILMKLVVQVLYARLLRASESMSTSKNKLAKNMKKKFEAYYKLKLGVNNVDIFVDKHFFYYKFCGIFLSTWETLCGQVLVLSLLVGAISTILGLIYECGKEQILGTFTVGILSCGLLIFFEGIVNPAGKKEMIRLNMKDYLENVLKVRLVQEESQPELMEQYKKAYQPSAYLAVSKEFKETEISKPFHKKKKNKSREAKRLEKMSQKARKKDEALKKKENKKLLKLQKRTDAQKQRDALKEAKQTEKKERELNARRQKEAKKQEAARLKAEALENEQRKKEEKQQQKEIKKVLNLEKKQKGHGSRTTAQEKKENLLKEIQGRRGVEVKTENNSSKEEVKESADKTAEPKKIKEAKAAELEGVKEVNVQEEKDKVIKTLGTNITEVKPAGVRTAKVRDIKARQVTATPDITYRDDRTAAALEDGRSYRAKEYEIIKPTSEEEEKIIEDILKDLFA
ncbi:hypothetical protein [Anaerocolumna xylanovorans]|uniref:Uncharacterized protein n=1 Tax=Anaerocolumna xylanovorans DSM 12503 TaxID=1121345 RepID=A0A1M7YMC3_9FIRM|nr:hypothetical protein [Anaerocolumna xylanovorans]SHO53843.1 hypothetical protein SAMN02745217_04316 [Anaerocolumna xylanovorans DSM 12503]